MRERIPRNGMTARELAERTGYTVRTAQAWTSEPRAEYLARANRRHEEIRKLYASGLSMRAVAKQLGVSVRAVHYAVHKN